MKKILLVSMLGLVMFCFTNNANARIVLPVELYVDSAPNVFGSSDYAAWEAAAFTNVVNGTFTNMASSINPENAGTTNFEIQDEVVYSFGDLGHRLTWIYWIDNATVADLTGNFEISLFNYWDTEPVLDFYDDYYGSTWLEPTTWIDYDGGVIGTAGVAWEEFDEAFLAEDLEEWGLSDERWEFTTRLYGDESTLAAVRDANVVPEPVTMILFSTGLIGAFIRKRLV